jgi:hypothetical protein
VGGDWPLRLSLGEFEAAVERPVLADSEVHPWQYSLRKPHCSGMNDAHSMASSLVAHWRPKPILEVHEVRTIEHEFFRLTFPGPYLVAVTFYRVDGRPDLMRVRSSNWRTQDEPNGIFRIEDCREFYRRLRRAGFA